MALTLASAAVVRPPATQAFGAWRAAAARTFDAATSTPERSLCETVYGDAGLDARRLGAALPAPERARFRDAGAHTQRDLALAAFDALLQAPGGPGTADDCSLLLYAAASMDVHFHQSPVGWLAARYKLTRRPHFALAQLQGAALAGAADIIDAMLDVDGAAAFVAAEAWPLPFPRACAGPSLLGDAGAALWLTRACVPGLRLAGTWQQSCDPFVLPGHGDQGGAILHAHLRVAAEQVLLAALAYHGFDTAMVDGWLPSGFDMALDESLRQRCAPRATYAALPRADDGWFCSAASAVLCADVLDRVRAGELADGALLLSWGVSLGGAIGVSLWRVASA